jgi:hypothetical protein
MKEKRPPRQKTKAVCPVYIAQRLNYASLKAGQHSLSTALFAIRWAAEKE